MGDGGGMAQVDLVEGEPGPHPPMPGAVESGAPDGPDARAQARRRRRRRYALGAVGALALGLVATQAVVDARERGRDARLSEVPGVLAPLQPDARQLWQASPDDGSGIALGTIPVAVGEALVAGTVDADGTVRLGAVDPDTGRQLWSVTTPGPGGEPMADAVGSVTCGSAASPSDRESAEPDGTTAACRVEKPTAYVEVGDPLEQPQFAARSAALLLVDVATGEITQRVDPAPATAVRDAPGGYVTATQDVDGGEVVARYAWGSPTPTWTARTGPPVTAEADGTAPTSLIVGADDVTVLVDAEHVALSKADAVWLLDASDGSLLDASGGARGSDATIRLLPDGGFLASWVDGSGATSRLVTADGAVEVLPSTLGPVPSVDDGSAAAVVLAAEVTRGSSPLALDGHDSRTGERLWRSQARFGWSIVVLDGVAYTSDGGVLTAIDLQDGSVSWTRTIERSQTQLLTDGTAALLVGQGRVDAYDLRDGEPLWSSLVVRTDESVGLRPVTGGPSARATVTEGTTDTSSWATALGRHLALVSPSGEITVLG